MIYNNHKNPLEMKRDAFSTELNWYKADELPTHNEEIIVCIRTEDGTVFSTCYFFNKLNHFKFMENYKYTLLAWASFSELNESVSAAIKESETSAELEK